MMQKQLKNMHTWTKVINVVSDHLQRVGCFIDKLSEPIVIKEPSWSKHYWLNLKSTVYILHYFLQSYYVSGILICCYPCSNSSRTQFISWQGQNGKFYIKSYFLFFGSSQICSPNFFSECNKCTKFHNISVIFMIIDQVEISFFFFFFNGIQM